LILKLISYSLFYGKLTLVNESSEYAALQDNKMALISGEIVSNFNSERKRKLKMNSPREMVRSMSQSEVDLLSPYSTCDVSDALGKLGINSCLIDLSLRSPNPSLIVGQQTRICG
jgi:hypothetical protein